MATKVVRMEQDLTTKGKLARFVVTEEMREQMVKNGVVPKSLPFGMLYDQEFTGEVFVTVSTEKPDNWTDPSVPKARPKSKKKKS